MIDATAIAAAGPAATIRLPRDRDRIELTCRCGAPMELILQYDAFDGAINLGDTGRAYVFACAQRCSPTAFAARWDCC